MRISDWSSDVCSSDLVFVANHQSTIDICALFRAVPVPLRFLLKQEMTKVPFVGWYARAMGMVFIDRSNRRAALGFMRQSAELLRAGGSLCRSEERRVGKGWVRTCKSRWARYH